MVKMISVRIERPSVLIGLEGVRKHFGGVETNVWKMLTHYVMWVFVDRVVVFHINCSVFNRWPLVINGAMLMV